MALDRCPLGALCEPESKMGPLAYVDLDTQGRLSPQLPRSSEAFTDAFKQRSAAERQNSHLKDHIGDAPYRRQHHLTLWTFAWMLSRHAQAWTRKRFADAALPRTREGLLDALEKIQAARAVLNATDTA